MRSKVYTQIKSKMDNSRGYGLDEAIKVLKDIKARKFDETLELHVIVKKQGLNVTANLPHSTGKDKKIEVADDETIKKLETGKVDFDVLLSTADFMPKLVKFARLLGPKGMMPNPKNGTLIKKVEDAKNFSLNSKTIKTEKDTALIHTSFGKLSQEDKDLVENATAIIDAINTKQIVKAYMKSTMSPSLKLSL